MTHTTDARRTVLITGGARRLGAVLCQTFAAAGWQVLCHYQHSAREALALQQQLADAGTPITLYQADLADAAQRQAMMQAIAEQHGGRLTLSNRPEGGLAAELRLPIA